MNVTVFATVGQVAVFSKQFSLTPVSGIIVFFFSCREKNRSSLMWFHHHLKMVIVVRVVFTYYKWRSFFFFSLSLRTLSLAPGKKKYVVKITV